MVLNNSINEPGRIIVDVRGQDEVDAGNLGESATNWIHIPEKEVIPALKLGASDFLTKYGVDIPAKSAKVIVHCKSGSEGGRSARAAAAFKDAGYDAEYYPGGYLKWKENFVPVTLPLP